MIITESGDVGFCQAAGHTSAITRKWKDGIVISVDCNHETCGFADECEMYQHKPIGYHNPKNKTK